MKIFAKDYIVGVALQGTIAEVSEAQALEFIADNRAEPADLSPTSLASSMACSTMRAVSIEPQFLTESEKAQIRTNLGIGAGGGGADGKSAYQVALDNGFVGTEAEWLASLVGADGADGIQGPVGLTGPAGTPGVGVPAGGTTGQILVKNSNTDYDTAWAAAPTGGGGGPGGLSWSFDGDGYAITPQSGAFIPSVRAGTITKLRLLGDVAGTCSVEIRKSTWAGYPTDTQITTIDLTAANKSEVTGLNLAIASGDILRAVVLSSSLVTNLLVQAVIE